MNIVLGSLRLGGRHPRRRRHLRGEHPLHHGPPTQIGRCLLDVDLRQISFRPNNPRRSLLHPANELHPAPVRVQGSHPRARKSRQRMEGFSEHGVDPTWNWRPSTSSDVQSGRQQPDDLDGRWRHRFSLHDVQLQGPRGLRWDDPGGRDVQLLPDVLGRWTEDSGWEPLQHNGSATLHLGRVDFGRPPDKHSQSSGFLHWE